MNSLGETLWHNVGISWQGALSVVFATVVLYIAFTFILKRWGARLFSGRSTITFAIATGLAAIIARASLGPDPTMMGGLIAVATLISMEWLTAGWFGRQIRRHTRERAAIVMVGGELRSEELAHRGVSEEELWEMLRHRGVHNTSQVGLVIVEANGNLSLIKPGQKLDPRLLVGVAGREDLPDDWFTG